MGILSMFGLARKDAAAISLPQASVGQSGSFSSLQDPRLLDFMRDGLMSASGFTVNVETALRNPAMFRAVSLISNSIGMLPFGLIERETKEKAVKHPLHRILHRRPNDWQTAFDFRAHMQLLALVHRDAYARIVWSKDIRTGKDRVARLIPLDSKRMDPKLQPDWTMRYDYQAKEGGKVSYTARDIFHLRGFSLDGIHGFSLVEQAREAIGLALSAELAAGRIFKNGSFVDGVLVSKTELSDEAYNRLKASWAERYQGADNAGKTPLLEGDTEYKPIGLNAKDAEMTALRALQIEEISRVSGVPRPLMMVDETSWGSGIQALGQFFVGYGLNPWFEACKSVREREHNKSEAKTIAYTALRHATYVACRVFLGSAKSTV